MARVAEGFRDAEGGGKADAASLVRRTLAPTSPSHSRSRTSGRARPRPDGYNCDRNP